MALLTDDQKMLQDTAASFLAEEGSIAKQLRHWRDIGCKDGFGHGLWKQFAELGLTGICIPETHGGMGLGATEAALVLEEIGRNLTPSPFLSTAVAAARAIEGTAHADHWYPAILSGEAHPASPSMMKYAGTELNKRRNELAMAAGGTEALEWEATPAARTWLRSKGNSIEGGTSEIQLNIVAKHILGLPGT